jgi:hypothetical protein
LPKQKSEQKFRLVKYATGTGTCLDIQYRYKLASGNTLLVVKYCRFSLKRLMEKISQENKAWVRAFEKPNTSPNSLGIKGSHANDFKVPNMAF